MARSATSAPARRRRLTLRPALLLLAAIVACTLGATASSASARVLWTADAEHATYSEWASNSCESNDRVRQVGGSIAAQGKRAYEFELRDGDDSYGERCKLGQGNPTRAGFPLFKE